jgi:Domain of unknown function (DUF4349)
MTDAELQSLLADVRPRPDAAWAARLDALVERGFAAAPPRSRGRPRWRLPALAAGLACAVALIVVVGLATGGRQGSTNGSSAGGAGTVESAGSQAATPRSAAPDRTSPAPRPSAPPTAASAPSARRAVERAADLTLSAPRDRVAQVADGVVHATEAAGGFVASSNVSTGTYPGASFTLRVPAGRLARTLSALSALAHVRSLNQSVTDITDVIAAARGRLRDQLAERASLRRRLALATDATAAARLQAQLRRVARRVEAARRALAHQRSRASLSTVLVTVAAQRRDRSAAGGGTWTPRDALHDAVRVLEVTAGVLLIALAVALPIGLLGAAAWAAVRAGSRRRRERLLDMA